MEKMNQKHNSKMTAAELKPARQPIIASVNYERTYMYSNDDRAYLSNEMKRYSITCLPKTIYRDTINSCVENKPLPLLIGLVAYNDIAFNACCDNSFTNPPQQKENDGERTIWNTAAGFLESEKLSFVNSGLSIAGTLRVYRHTKNAGLKIIVEGKKSGAYFKKLAKLNNALDFVGKTSAVIDVATLLPSYYGLINAYSNGNVDSMNKYSKDIITESIKKLGEVGFYAIGPVVGMSYTAFMMGWTIGTVIEDKFHLGESFWNWSEKEFGLVTKIDKKITKVIDTVSESLNKVDHITNETRKIVPGFNPYGNGLKI